MLPPLAHHAVVYAAVSSPHEINTVSPLAPLLRSRPLIHANAKPDRFGRQAPIWYQDTMTTRPITSNHSATRRHTGRVQTENARSLTGDAHACAKVNPLAESTGSHPTIMATIAEAVAVGRKHWTSTRSRTALIHGNGNPLHVVFHCGFMAYCLFLEPSNNSVVSRVSTDTGNICCEARRHALIQSDSVIVEQDAHGPRTTFKTGNAAVPRTVSVGGPAPGVTSVV
ncbi:hypothetical protein TGRH88_023220 [Toxoplasma gondii]|uniref:Uncharacterized protein n=1 Tax=Toxoplasma gondii TaxID=5811 RepID=A0A7J6KF56_TOXGO|nr:hypothetical protein TGRH88_023220 [Toxoplasma gondii]